MRTAASSIEWIGGNNSGFYEAQSALLRETEADSRTLLKDTGASAWRGRKLKMSGFGGALI